MASVLSFEAEDSSESAQKIAIAGTVCGVAHYPHRIAAVPYRPLIALGVCVVANTA